MNADTPKEKAQKIAGKVVLGIIALVVILIIIGNFTGPSNSLDPDYKACRDKWRSMGSDSTEAGKAQDAICTNMLHNNLSR